MTVLSSDNAPSDEDTRPVVFVEYIPPSLDPYDRHEDWLRDLRALLPTFRVETFTLSDSLTSLSFAPNLVHFAVIWYASLAKLSILPSLRAVLLRGSGSDQVTVSDLPSHIPLIRLIDPHASEHLSRFILHWVLHAQIRADDYITNQQNTLWKPLPYAPLSTEMSIGVMGFGLLAQPTVHVLTSLSFHVRVWRRTESVSTERVSFFTDFERFTDGLDILVNFVPLNEHTRGIVDEKALNNLNENATLISVGRGATIDTNALLKALDSGHLKSAVLDTFVEEPLRKESPLWKHPKIVITPHMAGRTCSRTGSAVMVQNIHRVINGETPFPVVPR